MIQLLAGCAAELLTYPRWLDAPLPRHRYGCTCPVSDNSRGDKNCLECAFNAGENGANTCGRCKGGKYLHGGNCLDSCDGTGLAECVAPRCVLAVALPESTTLVPP